MVILLGLVGVSSVYCQEEAPVKKTAIGFNLGDLIFPGQINYNTGFLTISAEYSIARKFSVYMPLSYHSESIGGGYSISIIKLELHPRLYLVGGDLKGLFLAPYIGMMRMTVLNMSATTLIFGGDLGFKLALGNIVFAEIHAGYGYSPDAGSGIISALTLGVLL